MGQKRILIFLLIIVLLSLLSIYYPKLTGEAVKTQFQEYPREEALLLRVIDGDTIEAKVNDETWKIRMLGINTPEKNMPFSNESKNFLRKFENKTLILERDWEDLDKYKRKLRYVYYESRFLNQEILELGYANSYYTKGLKHEKVLLDSESQAKNLELGIWIKSSEECSIKSCIILKELDPIGEFFIIKNICDFSCSMKDWFAKDAGRNVFYLSSLNSLEEKTYFSDNKEVWNNEGDRFFIFDKQGKLVLFYEY